MFVQEVHVDSEDVEEANLIVVTFMSLGCCLGVNL
jgi:hypothetical protein